MIRCCLVLAYDGTDFRGWQKNGRARAVQEVLELALRERFRRVISLEVASRTDAGVHALGQCAAFDATGLNVDFATLPRCLNARLPDDVTVVSAKPAPNTFHPSLMAQKKHYRYAISQNPHRLPLLRRSAWHIFSPLCLQQMRRAAQELKGERDYRSFANVRGTKAPLNSHCELYEIAIAKKREHPNVIVDIWGNRFLYKMVRNLVGTLVEVGLGKKKCEEIGVLLSARDRARAGIAAPAHGLTLMHIAYGQEMVG